MVKELIESGLEILTLITSFLVGLLILLFILKFVFGKKTKIYDSLVHFLQDNYLFLGFVVSLTATLGSLFYSEIIGYSPCVLCWYQRIFMYPQVFLFAIAMKIKNKSIIFNSLVLSVIGFLIASYHYLLQIEFLNNELLNCGIVGFTANCSEYFSLAYGYITIPFMALAAFLFLIILNYGKLMASQERAI